MAELTIKQVNLIHDLIVDHGIDYDELKMDILDHICCMIEEKMDSGFDFKESLSLSTEKFGLHQLSDLQETTFYLLTLKLRKMKKLTGILGIISSGLVLAGVVFKINHLQGAGIMLVIGLSLISLLVLPLFAFLEVQRQNTKLQKFTSFSGIIAGTLVSIGTLFKIMHWPNATGLLFSGLILMVGVFIPLFTIKNYKTTEYKLIAIAKSMLILAGITVLWGLLPLKKDTAPIEETHIQHHAEYISE